MADTDKADEQPEAEPKVIIHEARPVARNVLSQNLLTLAERVRNLIRPGTIDFEQFLACCVQATNVLEMDADKMGDSRTMRSYATCIQNCAVIGLLPGSALGHAYFVPYTFYRNSPREHTIIQLIPGYRGLLELAWGAKFLLNCDPEVVVADEQVSRSHDKDGPQIKHEIPIPRVTPTKDNILGAYCTYRAKGGNSVLGEFVEGSELQKLASKASGKSPWKTNFEAMCKKTAVRRTSKRWRQTLQLSRAVRLDEMAENDEEQELIMEDVVETANTIDLDKLPKSEGEGDE